MTQELVAAEKLRTTLSEIYQSGGLVVAVVPSAMQKTHDAQLLVTAYAILYVPRNMR